MIKWINNLYLAVKLSIISFCLGGFSFFFFFAIKGILFVHFIILEKALIKILGRFFKIYLQIQYYIFFFSDSFKILLYKYNFQFSYLFFDSAKKILHTIDCAISPSTWRGVVLSTHTYVSWRLKAYYS